MTVNHIFFLQNSQHGILLRNALSGLENGREGLFDVVNCITQMLDGDGSSDAHYTYITSKFGFTDTATAHAAYNELNSLMSKLNTDSAVTSVQAALLQAFDKFR